MPSTSGSWSSPSKYSFGRATEPPPLDLFEEEHVETEARNAIPHTKWYGKFQYLARSVGCPDYGNQWLLWEKLLNSQQLLNVYNHQRVISFTWGRSDVVCRTRNFSYTRLHKHWHSDSGYTVRAFTTQWKSPNDLHQKFPRFSSNHWL